MPKEKPVGEILKEEGIIKEEVEEKSVKEEIDVRNVLVEVEKLRAVVDTLKTVKFEADERIKELAEAIGEIRSLFFQRDAGIKEMETKLEKLDETVKDIKPERITKQLEEKDKEFDATNAKLEKLEELAKDLGQRLAKVEKILESIKSVENLKELVDAVQEKLSKMEELKSSVERDAAKTERFYLEGEKRLGEVREMGEKLSKLEELTKELVRSVDESRIKLDAAVTKEDLEKAIEEKLRLGGKKEEKLAEKEETKKEIESLLKSIEDQYNKGLISDAAYNEVVEKNKAMLEKLEKDIERLKSEEQPKDIGELLESIQEKVEELETRTTAAERITASKQVAEPEAKPEVEKPSPKVIALQERLKEAEELLATIEDQYRKGMISEKTYEEVKNKNLEQIAKIEKEVTMLETGKTPELEAVTEEPSRLDEGVEKLIGQINKLEELLVAQSEKMSMLDKKVASLTIRASDLERMLAKRNEPPEAGVLHERIEELRKKLEEAKSAE